MFKKQEKKAVLATRGGFFVFDNRPMKVLERLKELSARSRRIVGGAILFLLIALVYPFQTTVVPGWNLHVVDDQGNNVPTINVTQHWQHNSLESVGHEELKQTNSEGEVAFPRRNIRASLLTRAYAPILKVLREGTGAKLGTYASVVVWGSKDNETNVAVYSPDQAPPSQIVAARLR